ncbi:MAG: hypothetical protein ABI254_08945 [Chthoniobacterales bacterium]
MYYWISNWGLITLEGKNLKLSHILQVMSHQSGTEIVTNLDADTQVTVQFHHTPLNRAMEILAARTDANWQGVWIAGPDKASVKNALTTLQQENRMGDTWKTFNTPQMGLFALSADPVDPRSIKVKLSPMPVMDIASAFDQLSQKTGQRFILPDQWNPAFTKTPSEGSIRRIVSTLASAGKGQTKEVILLHGFRRNRSDDAKADGQPQFDRRNNRQFNPEWLADRIAIATTNLPPEEQAKAKSQFDEMRKFWASLKGLTPEQRREKMQEFFNRPDIQDQMELAAAQRDANRTPEQRENRYRNYIQRKSQSKGK